MKRRVFHLDVQPHLAAGAAIHALDQGDFLGEGRNLEKPDTGGKAPGKHRWLPGAAPLVDAQRLELFEAEIDGVEAAVSAGASGEARGDVRRCLQVNIVQYHGQAIAAQHHVLFDEIGALGVRDRLRRERVLGQIRAGAAVRDDQGVSGHGLARWPRQREQQGQQQGPADGGNARGGGARGSGHGLWPPFMRAMRAMRGKVCTRAEASASAAPAC